MDKNNLRIIVHTTLFVSSIWINIMFFCYGEDGRNLFTFACAAGGSIVTIYACAFLFYIFYEE